MHSDVLKTNVDFVLEEGNKASSTYDMLMTVFFESRRLVSPLYQSPRDFDLKI